MHPLKARAMLWHMVTLCLCLPFSLAATREPDIRFIRYGLKDGMSQSTVYQVLHDQTGFLWFATQDGLNRFDGYSFRTFKHQPDNPYSLPDNWINALVEDNQGSIWIGTRHGLARFDPRTERFYRFTNDPSENQNSGWDRIYGLLQDSLGRLWIGTYNGIYMLEKPGEAMPETAHYTHFLPEEGNPNSLASPRIMDLYQDRDGLLWISTYGDGFSTMDPARPGVFENYTESTTGLPEGKEIYRVKQDSQGNMLIATGDGLVRYSKQSKTVLALYRHEPGNSASLPNNTIRDVYEDEDGYVWVATHGGLARFPLQKPDEIHRYTFQATNPTSISHNELRCIVPDRTGNLWIGTYGDGVNKLDGSWEQIGNYSAGPEGGLSSNQVWGIRETRDGSLWIATDIGLNVLPPGAEHFTHYLYQDDKPGTLNHTTVKDVIEGPAGRLWIATDAGLNYLEPGSDYFHRFEPVEDDPFHPAKAKLWCMFLDPEQNLWIGSERGGLSRLDLNDVPAGFTRYPAGSDPSHTLVGSWVIKVAQDKSGNLWLGYHEFGLQRMVFRGGKPVFTWYSHDPKDPESLSHNSVFDVHEDGKKRLWVGTFGGGLNLTSAENPGRFVHYREADGLPNDGVYSIREDENGHLWLSTNFGIARFDPETETFYHLTASDGLQSDEFNVGAAYQGKDGTLYFGGINGLTFFHPSRLPYNDIPPDLAITSISLFNRTLPVLPEKTEGSQHLRQAAHLTREIRLGYQDYVFSFEFAAMHYTSPKRNRYAFMLEGLDPNWIITSSDKRFASYANVAPGKYTFRVKGSNKNGIWAREDIQLKVIIDPPPWKTWWAYGIYTLLVAAGILGLLRMNRGKLMRERALNERLRQVDRLKDEFLANTSHELRTPLNGMIGLAESLLDGATGELPKATKKNLSMLAASGRRLANLVNDLLDFSRLRSSSLILQPRPVDLHSTVDVVLTLSRVLVGNKKIDLRNEVPKDDTPVMADEDRLQQILHNLIGNALKFTQRGHVAVSTTMEEDQVVVHVRDTGIGIPQDQHERIFESFQQVDGAMEREYSGTGLGLAVSRHLVQLHGGRLWVSSEVGVGSIFSFTLPRAEEGSEVTNSPEVSLVLSDTAEDETYEPLTTGNYEGNASDGFSILIVDDEPVNRQVLVNHLSLMAHNIILANGGEEALAQLEQQKIDLVLLDIMMPRISGFEVCKRIRKKWPVHELPVIFLSAKNRVNDLAMGFEVGANDYLTKPITKEELLARVELHLRLVGGNRTLDQRNHELAEKNAEIILREEEKMASLRTLTAGVAHEINNATNYAHGSLQNLGVRIENLEKFIFQIASDDADPEILQTLKDHTSRIEKELNTIELGTRRIMGIVKDLDVFARAHGTARQVMNLEAHLRSVIALVSPKYGETIRFQTTFQGGIELECRPAELNQVFMHLIVNACEAILRKSSNKEEPPLGIVSISTSLEDGLAIIRIGDTGCGMSADVRDKVFDPFFTTKPIGEGTGLGLSIAYGIVRGHQGRIEVSSNVVKGTVFTLKLPLVQMD